MPKTTASTAKIKAAMQAPDKGVNPTDQRRAASFTQQVEGLNLGESCSRVVGLDSNLTLAELSARVATMREALRNNTAPSVRRASERSGNKFTIEIADVRTPGDNFFIVAIVTRTA